MISYPMAAVERAMRVQDVMLQAMAKKITWWQAAEILGISDRHSAAVERAMRVTRHDVAGDGEEDYVVGKFAVGSKLKCPVFVAHEMSGLTI